MRSCQLVYLLLLICSVQGLDARALDLLVPGAVGTAAFTQADEAIRSGNPLPGKRTADARDLLFTESGPRTTAQYVWASPAVQAAAVATFTSLTRS